MTEQDRLAPAQRRGQLAPAAVPLRRTRPAAGLAAPPPLPAAPPTPAAPTPAAPEPVATGRGLRAAVVLVVVLLAAAAGQGVAALVLPGSRAVVALAAGLAAGLAVLVAGLLLVRRTSSST